MKRIILPIYTLLTFTVFAQTEAPLNPDYIKYLERKVSGQTNQFTSSGDALGEVPEITSPHFSTCEPVTINKSTKSLPASYDLRALGLVTPVKNQNPYNTCWTFASAGAIESHWLKTGFGEFDLAERNVATCNGFEWGWNNGGNRKLASVYYTRLSGPILESEEPYAGLSVDTTCHTGLIPVAYESEARFLPQNMDSIKQALIDFGAIYTNYYHNSFYYNSTDKTYYCPDSLGTNHAVLIVGWDDNYVTDAPNNGAWIIKNSWGTSWGESGFFYLSYYDVNVNTAPAYFISRLDYNAQAHLYMYDELGPVSNTGYSSETAYGLIKFVATGNQVISRVGTYVNSQSAVVSIEIYDNKSGNVLSGLLGSLLNQQCDYPGFYMFDLPSGINISSGNDFYIKVMYNTPGYNFPIPYEKYSAGYANPVIEAGVCWISSTGASWTAIGNDVTGKERDLCIRAYAVPQTSTVENISQASGNASLYPNPFTGCSTLKLSSEITPGAIVSVYDVAGALVSSVMYDGKNELSIGKGLMSGMYLLKITSDDNSYSETIKFVKID